MSDVRKVDLYNPTCVPDTYAGLMHWKRGRRDELTGQPIEPRRNRIPPSLRWNPYRPGGKILTNRQREVLGMFCECDTAKEVAERLNLCVSTIDKHLEEIYRKLDVKSRVPAVVKAVKLGEIVL